MSKAQVVRSLLTALQAPPFELPATPHDKLDFRPPSPAPDLTLRNACVCANPEFRVSSDLDLSPEILVLDHGLGTIGLVHVLEHSTKESLSDQAKRHVDQATYLRHLLTTDAVTVDARGFPLQYTVECVLAVGIHAMREMVQVVREIATRTRFLHATGLNLVPIHEDGTLAAGEVRRAFAWLLPATRRRLFNCAAPSGPTLRGLELSNYRLPGKRPWTLSENRVHLLHGANGTGKSSIAEALELVVTGAVERIKSHPRANYGDVIRNSALDRGVSAQIAVSMSNGSRLAFTVNDTGIAEPAMQPGLPITAFRLDQVVMDQLVRADSQQRARVLTRAFFPGDAYDALERAQQVFNNAYRDLPPEIRQQIQVEQTDPNKWHTAIEARLQWADAPTMNPERIADCLPLKREHIEVLARIVPELKDALAAATSQPDRTAFETELARLDEALKRLRSDVLRYRDAVVRSIGALQRLATWAPSSEMTTRKYSDVLDVWSDRVALSDLLQKHLEISSTVLDARAAAWTPGANAPGLLAASTDDLRNSLLALTALAARCTEEQRAHFNQLQGASGTGGTGVTSASSALAADDVADLNLIGGWFGRQQPTPPKELLGNAIQAAIAGNTTAAYGGITIGSTSWSTRVVEFLEPLGPALSDLVALEPSTAPPVPADPTAPVPEVPVYRSPLARLHAYRAALTAAREVSRSSQLVEATLMQRLSEHLLNEALDEVVALFTPARWAYEGLLVSTQVSDGKVGVDLLTSQTRSPAEMRLNTAELNVIVLALYLLCAPTIDNPLGTVILDDPLQNMDELTSATVARGVAKIAALLPPGWQLLLMFHGEEGLETFRREVPASVYSLPWLGPAAAVQAGDHGVREDASRTSAAVKTSALADVMERRSKKPTKGQ